MNRWLFAQQLANLAEDPRAFSGELLDIMITGLLKHERGCPTGDCRFEIVSDYAAMLPELFREPTGQQVVGALLSTAVGRLVDYRIAELNGTPAGS